MAAYGRNQGQQSLSLSYSVSLSLCIALSLTHTHTHTHTQNIRKTYSLHQPRGAHFTNKRFKPTLSTQHHKTVSKYTLQNAYSSSCGDNACSIHDYKDFSTTTQAR